VQVERRESGVAKGAGARGSAVGGKGGRKGRGHVPTAQGSQPSLLGGVELFHGTSMVLKSSSLADESSS